MKSKEISQIKHILSSCLKDNSRVIDMGCGSCQFTRWLYNRGKNNLIPMSPEYMEHISHENPFVAYNNFINDDRKVPVEDTRADAVLLLGPLYTKQRPEKRIETVKEIKRLINDTGMVITVSNNSPQIMASKKPALIPVKYSENEVLEKAGFDIKKAVSLSPDNSGNVVTIATVKPAISRDAIPPEVIIRIPRETLNTIDFAETKNDEEKIIRKENYISNTEIKPSIDSTLQNRTDGNVSTIKRSIDPTLQPPVIKTFLDFPVGIKMDLPILPTEITELYSNDNSVKENNNDDISTEELISTDNENNNVEVITDSSDKELKIAKNPEIPIRPSIDSNLVVRADIEKILKPQEVTKPSSDDTVVKAEKESSEKTSIPIRPSIDKNLVVRTNEEKTVAMRKNLDELAKVHNSIDKTLQMRLPEINPRYAKPKSRKKGTKNLFKTNLR